ncbi:hypothetical protein DOK_06607 [gamma proteobacterium BDW918]|uniref:Uncharacterized protein n=1 Tax=Zhongshania aliphaticivorans TaxID=1470434 RepID=A0A127M7M1_9GAMM|nr:hypothetical protein [Zhongshania aliphaticivorans]AMO69201.1 hypothetical protein AZF00_13200 [Zhongshania aliphaticivorans]EIF43902.1 hypothetical protein DOK_06607 [gamma proteobacterium BDW918]
MNIMQKFLANTLRNFGSNRNTWPRWRQFLLSICTALSDACRQDWQAAQSKVNAADTALAQTYIDGVAELAVSSAMARRLHKITAQPQCRAELASEPGVMKTKMPFWQIGFASAMASAVLGVALGAGGYVAELSDFDAAYLETSMTYEVSDWLAGDIQ